jgi:coenzyme F420-0:L-glutamate ligase/coenzyme F420-1:gamma-L-glutamate ligase
MSNEIRLIGLEGIPEVGDGDSLVSFISAAAEQSHVNLADGDVLVIAQKIVSKSEGRVVNLESIQPSAFARTLAQSRGVDPRFIELVLRESRRILRMDERVIIAETHYGLICANAGIDRSNVAEKDHVSLLPADPDASARRIRDGLEAECGVRVAVIVCDTFGRPWREGLINFAIGLAGLKPLSDLRNQHDDFGRKLHSAVFATADEVAAAAGLIMRKTERLPVVLVKGLSFEAGEDGFRALLRPRESDLFRY